MTEIKYPEMRAELVEELRSLADRGYQERVWVARQFPSESFYDDFTQTFEILEDLGVLEDPYGRIGVTLASREEADALAGLEAALARLFARYGWKLSDAEYLATPEWEDVLAAAEFAYRLVAGVNP